MDQPDKDTNPISLWPNHLLSCIYVSCLKLSAILCRIGVGQSWNSLSFFIFHPLSATNSGDDLLYCLTPRILFFKFVNPPLIKNVIVNPPLNMGQKKDWSNIICSFYFVQIDWRIGPSQIVYVGFKLSLIEWRAGPSPIV